MRVVGNVVHGKGEGRKIGYPTANVAHDSLTLSPGVFVCLVHVAGQTVDGLAVVGMWRQENNLPSLEVHLLDFDDDVYGKELAVDLGEKLRNLKTFEDTDALVAQIQKDVEDARTYVHRHRP